jgi:hypothetical protein
LNGRKITATTIIVIGFVVDFKTNAIFEKESEKRKKFPLNVRAEIERFDLSCVIARRKR